MVAFALRAKRAHLPKHNRRAHRGVRLRYTQLTVGVGTSIRLEYVEHDAQLRNSRCSGQKGGETAARTREAWWWR